MKRSFSRLLVDTHPERLGPDAARWTNFIEEGAERMRNLLSDLLAYLQIAQPGFESARVDLNGALREAIGNLKAAIEESGATISADTLPLVAGQQFHFVQLFQNLIGNAIKYHGPASPRIVVSAEKRYGEWRFAEISVTGQRIVDKYGG